MERKSRQSEPTREEILKAIEALKSDDFKVRETATKKLWQMGRKAEPYLRRAVVEDSAELHYRGTRILSEFKLGLYPDTPEKIRNLVQAYRTGNGNAKELAINSLIEMGETDILIKLVKQENDPAIRAAVATRIAANVDEETPKLIFNDQLDKARDLLELAALSPPGMRSYSVFLLQTGKLDKCNQDAAHSLSMTQKPMPSCWPGCCVSVATSPKRSRSSPSSVITPVRGKHVWLQETSRPTQKCSPTPSRPTTDTLGFAAAAARLAGDMDKFEGITADIEQYARAHCLTNWIAASMR